MASRPNKGGKARGGKQAGTGLGDLARIEPLTENQRIVFESDRNVALNGCAGTGKSFITTYLGLHDIINENLYARLIYVRSAVSTRNIGFLPGKREDKVEVYERPYEDFATELFGRGDAYSILKQKGIVEFMETSFLRGTTMNDAVIIIDECQNMTYHELDSVLTRVGKNCRVFICGDYFQSDLDRNGLEDLHKVLDLMNSFDFVEFDLDDIVRSGFVKEYIIAKYQMHGKRIIR